MKGFAAKILPWARSKNSDPEGPPSISPPFGTSDSRGKIKKFRTTYERDILSSRKDFPVQPSLFYEDENGTESPPPSPSRAISCRMIHREAIEYGPPSHGHSKD